MPVHQHALCIINLECTDDEVYQGRNTENSVDTLLGLMYILFNFCIFFLKKHVLLLFTPYV